MRYLINLSYDGSKFYGYQIQKKDRTIEGELEKVLSIIFNEKIDTIGSSRTDAKVHAYNQFCHFDSDKNINVNKLRHSINSLIDKSIYIKKVKIVDDSFHSRYNVEFKEYIYKINMGEYNPIEKDYVYQYNKVISKDIIEKFINKMNGKHNFKSFTSDTEKNDYERDIVVSYKISKKVLYLTFKSSGFLRYMIRNIVGLLLDINDNKKNIDDMDKIFKSENRTSCGKCASPEGLYLNEVKFNVII